MAEKNEFKKNQSQNGSANQHTNDKKVVSNKPETEKVQEEKKESVYTVDEFCNNARALFKTMPECVRAAFAAKNVKQCSKKQAEDIVSEFLKKEVK